VTSELIDLDPDDPRPPSQRIANALRAAIRTRKFQPGERLPSQNELADHYDVSRETVKRALDILKDERLIVSRQGSGAFVRAVTERPIGLRPHVEQAFSRPRVTIDFAGFSGETLHGVLTEALDKVRNGVLTPESIEIRILLPDTDVPMMLPRRVDTAEDDPAVRERAARIVRRHTESISDAVAELADLGLVKHARTQVRVLPTAPLFKLYILNGDETFFGFYPVVQHTVSIKGEQVAIYDPMGKDAVLFHRTADEGEASDGELYVGQAQIWFNSIWETVARELPHGG
jgi:DNA-binding transcriptional regulator YhcF (GntR family)